MAGVQALHGAYGGYALECQGVGRHVGRNAVALGDGDDPADRILYAHHPLGCSTLVVALELVGDVYEAAGVYDVVRGVEDTTLCQGLAVPGLVKHVVRATGYDRAAEVGERLVVHDGAQGARGENIAGHREDLVRLHRLGPELLHRHRAAFQGGHAEDLLDTGPHPLQDAQSRKGGGIARAAVGHIHADDVRGLHLDVVHVPGRDPNILGDYVASAQSFYVAPQGAKESFGLVLVRVSDNDGLPPD